MGLSEGVGQEWNLLLTPLFCSPFFILLCEVLEVIPKSEYERFLSEAKNLLPEHPKDGPYFALALKLSIPIWSSEKRFKKQSKVKVFPTHELKELFLFG